MPTQTHSHSPLLHLPPDFEHFPLLAQEHDVDRKFHPDRVDSFAGNNPQTLSKSQSGSLQQPPVARRGGICYVRAFRENGISRLIPNTQFWQTSLNTTRG